MGASGVESLNVAASIFMGQTEAPLTIRPFLPKVTESELMVIMTAGMAHVSGGIMGAYILSGVEAKHLLTAVIMTAPGTIMLAKMMVPETRRRRRRAATPDAVDAQRRRKARERAGRRRQGNHRRPLAGPERGCHADLVSGADRAARTAFSARRTTGSARTASRWFPASLESIFGWIFAPVAFIVGVPWRDCLAIGNLLGTRMVLNELVAFTMLGAQKASLDPRSFTLATFALCGFANLTSIGIQIGGLGALAPNRRGDLARLGFRAMICGTMANLMSASIAGIFL